MYSSLARLVIGRKAEYEFGKGSALTLGVHHFNYNQSEVKKLFTEGKVAPVGHERVLLNERVKTPWMKSDAVDARTFFHWLGYPVVEELDYHEEEKPTIVHDLNQPVPENLKGKYDLVFDGGTTEHIFDLKTCLFNIVDLLRPGGTVIHAVPLSGWIDHGFIQHSPSLLWDFYNASQFSQIRMTVIQVSRVSGVPVKVWDLENPTQEPLLFNDFDCKTLLVVFARKTAASRPTIPIQGSYAKATVSQFAPVAQQNPCRHVARGEPKIRLILGKHSATLSFLWRLLPHRIFTVVHSLFLQGAFHRSWVKDRAVDSDPV